MSVHKTSSRIFAHVPASADELSEKCGRDNYSQTIAGYIGKSSLSVEPYANTHTDS